MLIKSELRKKLLQNRKSCNEKNQKILKNLLSLKEFREAELILTYISTDKEIDTRGLIKFCFTSGKQVCVPKFEDELINFYIINNLNETKKGMFGINEPIISCKKAQINSKSFCILPALACDKQGNRLGYGKGCYDRFLIGFEGISAVLSYSQNIIKIPVESHDIAANITITERGIIHNGR